MKKFLVYGDSYSYYGLWDETMRVFDDEGSHTPLSYVEPTIELIDSIGTRDAFRINLSLIKNTPIDNMAYVEILKLEKYESWKIKITYFSKNFEEIIPAILKKIKENYSKAKVTFVFDKNENIFIDEKAVKEYCDHYCIEYDLLKKEIEKLKSA